MSIYVTGGLEEDECAAQQGASELKAMLERAVLDEREACAKTCETINHDLTPRRAGVKYLCAKAIRDRSNK